MYRNKKLLDLAKDCPLCMGCRNYNDGTIVAAHSNQIRDGKGTGIKAHDYRIAYLCDKCHHEVDNGKIMNKHEKLDYWEAAHRKTISWLFESGYLTTRGKVF